MNEKEKKKLARQMLERNDYSDKEIKKILRYAFGDRKKRVEPIEDESKGV